jgi:hypothetical protein
MASCGGRNPGSPGDQRASHPSGAPGFLAPSQYAIARRKVSRPLHAPRCSVPQCQGLSDAAFSGFPTGAMKDRQRRALFIALDWHPHLHALVADGSLCVQACSTSCRCQPQAAGGAAACASHLPALQRSRGIRYTGYSCYEDSPPTPAPRTPPFSPQLWLSHRYTGRTRLQRCSTAGRYPCYGCGSG